MSFKLPIYYCDKRESVFDNLYDDLELLEGENGGMYMHLFQPSTILGKKILSKWAKYYTSDVAFLKNSQKLYSSLAGCTINKKCIERCWDIWNEIKKQENFLEKYQYVEWDKIQWLNKSIPFLGCMSVYNITSPVLNLLLPVIILIIPFFLLKIMGIPLTFSSYKKVLLNQIRNHSIGRLFTEFQYVSWNQRMYILASLAIYVYNIYQNIVSCYHFFTNTRHIDTFFSDINEYVIYTLGKMNAVIDRVQHLKTYQKFSAELGRYRSRLEKIGNSLPKYRALSTAGFMEIGKEMKEFYMFYSSENTNDVMLYSFEFNGYWDTIVSLSRNKYLNDAKYKTSKKTIVKFKNTFYAPLAGKGVVKNNFKLNKNVIITGPNAAGKTTLLKCIMLNVLFTQQVGRGFYDKALINPFDFIHCYLNIPDTSGRDSLFQAEARRCKNILSFIEMHKDKKHFCIFDELYSGTNHYEAIGSAYSYLKYISDNKNVRFMLTTHFIKLCSLFKKDKSFHNINMETNVVGMKSYYTYKILEGISETKGGICVLKQLNYPDRILRLTQKVIRML